MQHKCNIHTFYEDPIPPPRGMGSSYMYVCCIYVAFMLHFERGAFVLHFPTICILHLCCILIIWEKQAKPIGWTLQKYHSICPHKYLHISLTMTGPAPPGRALRLNMSNPIGLACFHKIIKIQQKYKMQIVGKCKCIPLENAT